MCVCNIARRLRPINLLHMQIAAAFHANEVIVYYSEPIEVNTQGKENSLAYVPLIPVVITVYLILQT